MSDLHYGMIATGNHWDLDSLRAAPRSGRGDFFMLASDISEDFLCACSLSVDLWLVGENIRKYVTIKDAKCNLIVEKCKK